MIASSPATPHKALLRLPVGVRLRLARFTLWRRRQAAVIKTTMLATCLAVSSAALGFVVAQPPVIALADTTYIDDSASADGIALSPLEGAPRLAAAGPHVIRSFGSGDFFPGAKQWGELQAEVLRLRLLFSRIAEAEGLADSEFVLAVQLADERYLNSLVAFEDTPETSGWRFALAERAVNYMTDQAQLMLDISQRRQTARNFTLSGTPVTRARITSRYGYRLDPRSGRQQFHRGLDFGGPAGSKVFALADGVVTYSGKNGGYGNLVELEHADGYHTRYAHNESNLVSVGDRVLKGQAIATMGSTGKSTGTHVHVEVLHAGRAVDPLQFINAGS